MNDCQKFDSMNISEIARKYGISVKTLRKWMNGFCPDVKPAKQSTIYAPLQIKKIVESCGEFPE